MTVHEKVDFDRALASLMVARRFAQLALSQLPESATGMSRDALKDLRDTADTAIEIVEESRQ